MVEAEAYQEELEKLAELAGTTMYGSTVLKKRILKLLGYKGKIKTAHEIRKEWSGIKGSMAEEIVRMREAE